MNSFGVKGEGVDFTNVFARIFRARFLYERLFSSYILQKTRAKTLVKSTQGGVVVAAVVEVGVQVVEGGVP